MIRQISNRSKQRNKTRKWMKPPKKAHSLHLQALRSICFLQEAQKQSLCKFIFFPNSFRVSFNSNLTFRIIFGKKDRKVKGQQKALKGVVSTCLAVFLPMSRSRMGAPRRKAKILNLLITRLKIRMTLYRGPKIWRSLVDLQIYRLQVPKWLIKRIRRQIQFIIKRCLGRRQTNPRVRALKKVVSHRKAIYSRQIRPPEMTMEWSILQRKEDKGLVG